MKLSGLLCAVHFTSCSANPTMLTKNTKDGLINLEVYVDDILLTGTDDTSIHATKTYL